MVIEIGRMANGGGMLYPYQGIWPEIAENCFIAPGARIVGDVKIGAGSSIWFNCVLRGDVGVIRIGERTVIQDGSVVHVDSGGFDTIIGSDVLIGHMALVHGTTIENDGFVGMDATTMDGSIIKQKGMLAAGSLLSPGKIVGEGEMWMGRPAKYNRDLDESAYKALAKGAKKYVVTADTYLKEYKDL
ncbi:MAG: gamma carbonic anhydrase family protein [Kordiimonadaceae bacterium]|jgi:gamma-carbonic anhydrase|nr:gamma carbonic anhydrase family protein [Kordiimonadaceae bacterium]MBT6036959.1 gamma carbonic anhydrase family protein [Kordiimonadaceae bacterium]MBT6330533.1 gamma carbonic anhydrase family protein [Kordiimonadaceae bacterium]MBT7582392.1 gamma carbonic anhydrase family protein [Kordiimonadaceae bacterium]